MGHQVIAKLTLYLLTLVILVSFAACIGSTPSTAFPAEPTPTATSPTSEVPKSVPTPALANPLVPDSIQDAPWAPPTQRLPETQDSVVTEASETPCGLAPDGVVVSAWVDGEEVARSTIIERSYILLVRQLDRQLAGKVVSFRIGTVATGQTAVWTQGSADELNLSATSTKGILVSEISDSSHKERGVNLPVPPHLFVGTVTLICQKERAEGVSASSAELGHSPTPTRTYLPILPTQTHVLTATDLTPKLV